MGSYVAPEPAGVRCAGSFCTVGAVGPWGLSGETELRGEVDDRGGDRVETETEMAREREREMWRQT